MPPLAGFTIGYLLTKFDLSRAIDHQDDVFAQLSDSVAKNPDDRRAVEHMVYTALFMPAPDGFETLFDGKPALRLVIPGQAAIAPDLRLRRRR